MAAKKEATASVPPSGEEKQPVAMESPSPPAKEAEAEAALPTPVLERAITAQAYVLSIGKHADPIGKAFLSGELRTNRLRKLTPTEWNDLYQGFLSAPR